MEDYGNLLQGHLEQAGAALSSKIAWFYLNFFSQPTDRSLAATANTIVFRKERELLSPMPGTREAQVLSRDSVAKKDLLAAQLYDIMEAYGNSLRLRDGPKPLQRALDQQIDTFLKEVAHSLPNDLRQYFQQGASAQYMAHELQRSFETAAQRLNAEVLRRYEQVGWYQILQGMAASPNEEFTYLASASDNTCARCDSRSGAEPKGTTLPRPLAVVIWTRLCSIWYVRCRTQGRTVSGGTLEKTPKPRAMNMDDIFKDGVVTIDDIWTNPQAFSGKSVDDIASALEDAGYDITIKKSRISNSGAEIIQINNSGGGKNITQVQVSPGGGRHGPLPYVKISTNDQGVIKIVDGMPSSYITDGTEKATIIFSEGDLR